MGVRGGGRGGYFFVDRQTPDGVNSKLGDETVHRLCDVYLLRTCIVKARIGSKRGQIGRRSYYHTMRAIDRFVRLLSQAMRKKNNRDLRSMSKMELEVRRQKAAAARKTTQVRRARSADAPEYIFEYFYVFIPSYSRSGVPA